MLGNLCLYGGQTIDGLLRAPKKHVISLHDALNRKMKEMNKGRR